MRAIVRIGINIAVALSLTVPIWAEQVPLPLQWVERPEMGEGVESLGLDEQLWGTRQTPGDQQALLTAIDYSLTYLESSEAATAYAQYSVPGITRDRVRRSLERFRELVVTSESPVDLQTSVLQEFELYQSIGADGNGTVSFTGYFQPTYLASRTPTDEFRYPLYRLPPNSIAGRAHTQLVRNWKGLTGYKVPKDGYRVWN